MSVGRCAFFMFFGGAKVRKILHCVSKSLCRRVDEWTPTEKRKAGRMMLPALRIVVKKGWMRLEGVGEACVEAVDAVDYVVIAAEVDKSDLIVDIDAELSEHEACAEPNLDTETIVAYIAVGVFLNSLFFLC